MFKTLKEKLKKFGAFVAACVLMALPASATAATPDIGTATTSIGTALEAVLGFMGDVTSSILGNNLWLLGMGFFVLLFIAGFVMYLFRVGRR